MCTPVVMNIHQLMKEDFSPHNQRIQTLLSDAETAVCVPRGVFSKVGTDAGEPLFPGIHLAAPEEEGCGIISGAHDPTQEYCSSF